MMESYISTPDDKRINFPRASRTYWIPLGPDCRLFPYPLLLSHSDYRGPREPMGPLSEPSGDLHVYYGIYAYKSFPKDPLEVVFISWGSSYRSTRWT